MTFKFDIEWQEAPGVEDELEALTWGRLGITAAEQGNESVLTLAVHKPMGQTRTAVYGSVYPLARWLADSYWNLLYEELGSSRAQSARMMGRNPRLRPWVGRHGLLAAREGFALPDVLIYRDGDRVAVDAFPDPDDVSTFPVSFVALSHLRLSPEAVDEGIRLFMEAVLERTAKAAHPDAASLRRDWDTVLAGIRDEPDLCRSAARLGLDPHDPDELSDGLLGNLLGLLSTTQGPLLEDLLDGVEAVDEVSATAEWARENDPGQSDGAPPFRFKPSPAPLQAYAVGYRRARELRAALGLADEVVPIGAVQTKWRFGLDSRREPRSAPPGSIDALVAANGNGAPVVVGPARSQQDDKFRWSRALYLWLTGSLEPSSRLLTRSHARLQREARAFGAELLAPASALRREINRPTLGGDDISKLAADFAVSPLLIMHQVENHALAELELG